MSEMAILVMGYRAPEVLRAAVPVYVAAGCDIYVHVDAKRDLADYVSALGNAAENCKFVSDRLNIFWGGYSMVEAELALITAAMSKGNYTRLSLVSDDTFPIIPPARLQAFLAEPVERIMLRKLTDGDPFMKRYKEFFILDHPVSSLLGRPIESAAVDTDFLASMEALVRRRALGKSALPIYYGSQWWSLTRKTILDILTRLEDDPAIAESFRFSAVPDEIFFQSLVGNSVAAAQLRGGPLYVDWSKDVRPYIFRNASELTGLAPQYAFARKFSRAHASAYQELVSTVLR
jgi:hypothetical protein